MARFRVDPRVVKQVAMKDGTFYKPSRDGWVHVAAKHEAEMSRSGARRSHAAESQISTAVLSGQGLEGWVCPSCSQVAWRWQRLCGRCGTRVQPL